MKDEFLKFLRDPNPASFLTVRKGIVEHPNYKPYSEELEELEEFIDAEDYDAVLALSPTMLPNLMLSPRLHLMLAYTHRRLGDTQSADMESAVARACVEGILMTGRGTKQEPWLVTRTSDEYDVLMFIDRKMETQALVHDGDRVLDCLTGEDGKESWFDITDAYKSLNESAEDS